MSEDEQVALQIIREWVVELNYGHLPPGKISELTDRIATALRTQREAQWRGVLKVAEAYICDHGSKATYEALKFYKERARQ